MIKNRVIGSGQYGTHLVPLIAAVMATDGIVIEFGVGDFSTPVLHEIFGWDYNWEDSEFINRKLISYESDEKWLNNFIDLKSDRHEFILIDNWDSIEVLPCSVLLVDHAPSERRIVDIDRFKDHAEILVVHDTDKMKYYGYDKVFGDFKYKKTYDRYSKSTTLLSNFTDITKLI